MKTVKFRGKRIDNNEWAYGYYFYKWRTKQYAIHVHESEGILADKEFEVIPETVGQFTGLQDSKGKDIYEGNIVKQTAQGYYNDEHMSRTYIGEVVIIASKGACLKRPKYMDEITGKNNKTDHYVNVAQYRSEVIGNIHEDKNLLK